MFLHKSFVLAWSNRKVMLKALLCQILILALVVALLYLIFGSVTEEIMHVFAAGEWGTFLTDTVRSIGDATFDGQTFLQQLTECVKKTKEAIEEIQILDGWDRVELSYISCLLLLLGYRVMISFSDVAVGFQLNEFMTSNMARPFSWYLFKKFGESLHFSLLQMAVTLPLDFMVLCGSFALCAVLVLTTKWWTIIPLAVLMVALYSMRIAYFAFWLPAVATDNLKVSQALKKGLATIPYRFWRVFVKTFATTLLMAAILIVGVAFVENNILKLVIVTVPNLVLFFMLKCVNFIEYFEAQKAPYFYKYVDVEGTERFERKHCKKIRKA